MSACNVDMLNLWKATFGMDVKTNMERWSALEANMYPHPNLAPHGVLALT